MAHLERTADYAKNAARAGKHHPCARCGRAIKDEARALWIELAIDGDVIPEGDARSNGPDSLGGFPVGPECRKHTPAEGGK